MSKKAEEVLKLRRRVFQSGEDIDEVPGLGEEMSKPLEEQMAELDVLERKMLILLIKKLEEL